MAGVKHRVIERIGACAAAVLALGLGACGSSGEGESDAAAGPPLVGVGSRVVAPVMAKWKRAYESRSGLTVDYRVAGDGLGIAPVARNDIAFGTQDAPITPNQYRQGGFVGMLPWAMTGVAVAYHLKGAPDSLKLNSDALTGILLGDIDRWNDPRIVTLNPDVRLPSTRIAVIDRREESAEDYVITNYLVEYSDEFEARSGITRKLDVPDGTAVNGSAAVTRAVDIRNGAIGFVALPEALAEGFAIARIENPAGKFVAPNAASIAAGAEAGIRVGPNSEVWIDSLPVNARTAYPLVTFNYAIVQVENRRAPDLKRFLAYAIGAEGQALVSSLHFVPLPRKVVAFNRRTIANIYAP